AIRRLDDGPLRTEDASRDGGAAHDARLAALFTGAAADRLTLVERERVPPHVGAPLGGSIVRRRSGDGSHGSGLPAGPHRAPGPGHVAGDAGDRPRAALGIRST